MKFYWYYESRPDGKKYHGYFQDKDGNQVYCDPQKSLVGLRKQAKSIFSKLKSKTVITRNEHDIKSSKDIDNVGVKP